MTVDIPDGFVLAEEGSDRLTLDRLALIRRWSETFGLDLRSGVEAGLATQEADHVAHLVDTATDEARTALLAEVLDSLADLQADQVWRKPGDWPGWAAAWLRDTFRVDAANRVRAGERHGRGAAMREPTSEECTNRTRIDLGDGRIGYACWYPQMGGYVGRALAVSDPEPGGCVDVFVWHDGEFPFLGEAGGDAQPPARLHHCDGGQFVAFGEFLLSIQGTVD